MAILLFLAAPSLVGLVAFLLLRWLPVPTGTGARIGLFIGLAAVAMVAAFALRRPALSLHNSGDTIALIGVLYSAAMGALAAIVSALSFPTWVGVATALLAPLTFWIWG